MTTQSLETPGLPAPASADELIDKREIAARLKISTRSVDEWQRSGKIPYLKIGKTVRYRWPDVLAHLQDKYRTN